VETRGNGFTEIARELASWLDALAADNGLLTVFICHTSASLLIQENADPNVQRDLRDALDALAPEGRPYAHQEEGPDDMPSHIKAMLTAVSLSIPLIGGSMVLGTWQASMWSSTARRRIGAPSPSTSSATSLKPRR
jgi:secondary thiamine-phosphate synthase enzyme